MARIFLQAAAGVALLTLSPFLLAIALAIRLESRGAALCLKERRGHSIFVFRTTTDVSGISVPTAFGSLLSKSGLDKLPLLVDVFWAIHGLMATSWAQPTLVGAV